MTCKHLATSIEISLRPLVAMGFRAGEFQRCAAYLPRRTDHEDAEIYGVTGRRVRRLLDVHAVQSIAGRNVCYEAWPRWRLSAPASRGECGATIMNCATVHTGAQASEWWRLDEASPRYPARPDRGEAKGR